LVAFLSYYLGRDWLSGYIGWSLYWRATVIGMFALQICFTVAMVIGGAKKQSATAAGVLGALLAVYSVSQSGVSQEAVYATLIGPTVLSLFAPATGIWFASLIIRFFATARFVAAGFWEIPKNFSETLSVMDVLHPAELVPGYREIDNFSSDGLIREFRRSKNPMIFIEIIAFLVPAYLYRFSIKSTWWFYYSLVYIASERELAANPSQLLERLRKAPKERLSLVIALMTVAGVLFFRLFPGLRGNISGSRTISVIEYLFLIDWHRIQPWLIASLISAGITIGAFFLATDAYSDLEYPLGSTSRAWLNTRVIILRYLLRVRTVASTLAMIILGCHALLAFTPVVQWFPDEILDHICSFYGGQLRACP
jgi:hypothetical protein